MAKLITQKEAADIAGVSKQAIGKLKKTRSFFTEDGKVDIEHADWKSYLKSQLSGNNSKSYNENPEDFHWGNFKPETIQEEKIYADILSKKIDIMKEMDITIEKKIVISAFGEIIKAIQSNFVDHGRRVSPLIAQKLGMPGTEKIIEKLENAEQKKNIEKVIHAVYKAIDKL